MNQILPSGCYVILHIGLGPTGGQESGINQLVVQGEERFELSDDIWIQQLDEQTATNAQTACEPPNYKIHNVERDRHLYAFVMRVPQLPKRNYEGMEVLRATVSLSRLVNPTSLGDRYCAQIMNFGLEDSSIRAIQFRGAGPDVFLHEKNRDWLCRKDGEILRHLMTWADGKKAMHPRIHRAFWNHEYAMRSSYIDLRWTTVVAGLEALISIGETECRSQFQQRVGQLAELFKVSLSANDLDHAYTLRSKLVHAENFLDGLGSVLPTDRHAPLYEKLESVLRETVKLALLDQTFGDSFQNDGAVNDRWPFVSAKKSKKP